MCGGSHHDEEEIREEMKAMIRQIDKIDTLSRGGCFHLSFYNMPKRQLRDRGGEDERRKQYEGSLDLQPKRHKTEDSVEDYRRRWTMPVPKVLETLPPPLTETDEDTFSRCLGFSEFASSKGLHVFANQDGPLPPKRKKRQYRQMLHVKGIYDIPLTRDQLAQKANEGVDRNKL
jgi:hypothetical protein